MTRHRSTLRSLVATAIVTAALFALGAPAGAITGGQEDSGNNHSNVGIVFFYQPDGRFRCSGTLVAPRVFLTAAHCTFQDIGKVVVSFDQEISRTEPESEVNIPRAADDSGPADAISAVGFAAADISAPKYIGEPTWVLGTPRTHPDYSDFTDIKNWNDTGVVILDEPVAIAAAPLAPENYLRSFRLTFNKIAILVVGYGTEVRQEGPPNTPIPRRQPIVRRFTTESGQKLTSQVFQMHGNEHDPHAGGGSCFGDSGGPAMHGGFVVGDVSYGLTNNCRYIGGYQRVDIPLVRNWLLDCLADLVCPSKTT